jgi:Cu-processing system ATP-binding protein
MITITDLHKSFGRLQVLRGVSLEIRRGEVTAVLGPNASGKTTLMKSVLGLVRPDAGTIRVGGQPVEGAHAYRRMIGYVPQNPRFPENLTVAQVLAMIGDLRGTREGTDRELFERFGLAAFLDRPLKVLSGGTRQKVSAVLAFLFDPDVVILDEPTAGLDPISSSSLKDKILAEKRRGKTIVLTSHVLSEVEELADRIVYLLDGRIRYDGSVRHLIATTGEPTLERAVAAFLRTGGRLDGPLLSSDGSALGMARVECRVSNAEWGMRSAE